jgi:hypothetical protein
MPGLVRMSLDSPEETRPFEGDMGQLGNVVATTGGPAAAQVKVAAGCPAMTVNRRG